MKIVILGSTGMLGNAVGSYFLENYDPKDIYLSYRNEEVSYGIKKFYFDALSDSFDAIPQCDYVINCIGVIKPFIDIDPIASIKINSIFPRQLADYCDEKGYKLIHITTDCVFSGKDGNYDESASLDCTDFYGKTKSLGEPNNCMVVRTSIIGEEIYKKASLIEWAKSQKGKQVNGFTNHLWNGITTKQYARICGKIIANNWFKKDLFHVFSDTVSKYQLLHLINQVFDLHLTINKLAPPPSVNRTLTTHKELNSKLDIPPIAQQIQEMIIQRFECIPS